MGTGLYVHVPFCERRCGYCDFYVEVRPAAVRERASHCLIREARLRGPAWPHGEFGNVFIGGGTPSLLGPDLLGALIRGLRGSCAISTDAEWTMEANPESADAPVLEAALVNGVNRLSIGVQSFVDDELRVLSRIHDSDGARQAYRRARAAGFSNVSIDLIYGLPGSTDESWSRTLLEAIDLGPEHISCYPLTLEPHVPLAARAASGSLRLPGDRALSRAYDRSRDELGRAGYEHYEISNWARPGRRCRHNLNVWRGGTYLGIGPGAHGNETGGRRANHAKLEAYLASIESGADAPHDWSPIQETDRVAERVMLGLRLLEGLPWTGLRGSIPEAPYLRLRATAERLASQGWLEEDEARLRIAGRGLFVSNALIRELLSAIEGGEG